MKSKLIRILIALCFVGVAVFGVVAFLANYNVESKTYSEIATIRDNTEFDAFYAKAENTLLAYGSTTKSSYILYINDATKELNSAIDYYLNYLQNMSGMNKNDKDSLVNKYREYISAINEAKTARKKYESFANKVSPSTSDKSQVAIQSANFAKNYILAYSKGYNFFATLQDMVDQKVFGGNMFKSSAMIKYEMESVFVNQSVNTLVGELEKKIAGKTHTADPYSASSYANNFKLVKANTTVLTEATELKNSTCANFMINYNSLKDIRVFLVDSSTYIANNSSEKTTATSVKSFLKNNLNLNMEASA